MFTTHEEQTEDVSKYRKGEPEKYKEEIEKAFKDFETYKVIQIKENKEKLKRLEELKAMEEEIIALDKEHEAFIKSLDLENLLIPMINIKPNEELLYTEKECDCLDGFFEIDKEKEIGQYQGGITLDSLVEMGIAHYKERIEELENL